MPYYKGPHPNCHKNTACACASAEECPINETLFATVRRVEWQAFIAGEKVLLDKEFANASIVEVVEQTPQRMYTVVKADDEKWTVMTYRLTKIKEANSISPQVKNEL